MNFNRSLPGKVQNIARSRPVLLVCCGQELALTSLTRFASYFQQLLNTAVTICRIAITTNHTLGHDDVLGKGIVRKCGVNTEVDIGSDHRNGQSKSRNKQNFTKTKENPEAKKKKKKKKKNPLKLHLTAHARTHIHITLKHTPDLTLRKTKNQLSRKSINKKKDTETEI